jgi:hypothetical protein
MPLATHCGRSNSISGFDQFSALCGQVGGMFKAADHVVHHRIALALLYILLFSGLSLMAVGLSVTHWIADNMGPKPMLACVVAYISVMSGIVWAINKINRAYPTLDLPDPSNHPGQAWFVEQVVVDVESDVAAEKSPPKREKPTDR